MNDDSSILRGYTGSQTAFYGLLAASFAPAILFAQGQPSEEVVEEVVVTAGFRESNLMSAAASISVVAESVIDKRAAQHLESVLSSAANINHSSGSSRARFIQIRGVGDLEQFVDPKHYPSVGITVDDINLSGTANAGMLFDAEQVEILRGPQGTRFGGSALAGMVNIRSNRPTNSLEGYFEAGAGAYGSWNLGGVISGPLGDSVSARLAVQQNESDGYIDNAFLGRDDTNGYDEMSVRATVEFEPGGGSAYSLAAFYFDSENGYDAFSLDNNRSTLSDAPGHDNQESIALSGRADWQLNNLQSLELITSWLESDSSYGFDEDWTFTEICDGTLCDPVFDFFSNTDNYLRDRTEVSADLRLLGMTQGSSLEYVFGLYTQQRDEDLHREYYGDFFSGYSTERQAIYGQIEMALADRIGLITGLRYERFNDSYSDSLDSQLASDDSLKSGEFTLTYQASDRTLLYATLSRGDKAGGVNTKAKASLPLMQPVFQDFIKPRLWVDTETLLNREFGLKGNYIDGRLDLRSAVFHMDRDGAQLESWVWDSVNYLWIGFLDNVDGSNWGAEIEFNFRFNDRVELFGSLGLLQAEIKEITTFDLNLNDFVTRRDVDQAKSPEWQYNVGADFSFSHSLGARLELEGRDDSRYGYYHNENIGSYNLMNASLSYQVGRTELHLWARNLTNEDYAVHGLFFGNDPRKGWINESYYQYGEPRVYGISAKYFLD
ncbi:MAG: TonB-dependent receptor [Candidatus Rariloculaceae bacterium]